MSIIGFAPERLTFTHGFVNFPLTSDFHHKKSVLQSLPAFRPVIDAFGLNMDYKKPMFGLLGPYGSFKDVIAFFSTGGRAEDLIKKGYTSGEHLISDYLWEFQSFHKKDNILQICYPQEHPDLYFYYRCHRGFKVDGLSIPIPEWRLQEIQLATDEIKLTVTAFWSANIQTILDIQPKHKTLSNHFIKQLSCPGCSRPPRPWPIRCPGRDKLWHAKCYMEFLRKHEIYYLMKVSSVVSDWGVVSWVITDDNFPTGMEHRILDNLATIWNVSTKCCNTCNKYVWPQDKGNCSSIKSTVNSKILQNRYVFVKSVMSPSVSNIPPNLLVDIQSGSSRPSTSNTTVGHSSQELLVSDVEMPPLSHSETENIEPSVPPEWTALRPKTRSNSTQTSVTSQDIQTLEDNIVVKDQEIKTLIKGIEGLNRELSVKAVKTTEALSRATNEFTELIRFLNPNPEYVGRRSQPTCRLCGQTGHLPNRCLFRGQSAVKDVTQRVETQVNRKSDENEALIVSKSTESNHKSNTYSREADVEEYNEVFTEEMSNQLSDDNNDLESNSELSLIKETIQQKVDKSGDNVHPLEYIQCPEEWYELEMESEIDRQLTETHKTITKSKPKSMKTIECLTKGVKKSVKRKPKTLKTHKSDAKQALIVSKSTESNHKSNAYSREADVEECIELSESEDQMKSVTHKSNSMKIRKNKSIKPKGKHWKCGYNECNASYDCFGHLRRHQLKKCHLIMSPNESLIGPPVKSTLKQIQSNHCHKCEAMFLSRVSLLTHLSNVHQIPVLQCDSCDYQCLVSDRMTEHKMIHSSDRPFKCLISGCIASYKQSHDLSRHESVINNIYPIVS